MDSGNVNRVVWSDDEVMWAEHIKRKYKSIIFQTRKRHKYNTRDGVRDTRLITDYTKVI